MHASVQRRWCTHKKDPLALASGSNFEVWVSRDVMPASLWSTLWTHPACQPYPVSRLRKTELTALGRPLKKDRQNYTSFLNAAPQWDGYR